ncbi:MAG: hypothetical protein P1U57_10580 [Oleibacter sp.]|nr:hypothetical protein [Thalassolituus sp.]
MIQSEKDFIEWLDSQLGDALPDQVVAFNINIYQSPFCIEIVGSNEFDRENEDWACNEDWTPQNRTAAVSNSIYGGSWSEAQDNIINMAKSYLRSGSVNAQKLIAAEAFSVGFVDGNLNYVK